MSLKAHPPAGQKNRRRQIWSCPGVWPGAYETFRNGFSSARPGRQVAQGRVRPLGSVIKPPRLDPIRGWARERNRLALIMRLYERVVCGRSSNVL